MIHNLLLVGRITKSLPSYPMGSRLPLEIKHSMQRRYLNPPLTLLHYLSNDLGIITWSNTVLIKKYHPKSTQILLNNNRTWRLLLIKALQANTSIFDVPEHRQNKDYLVRMKKYRFIYKDYDDVDDIYYVRPLEFLFSIKLLFEI